MCALTSWQMFYFASMKKKICSLFKNLPKIFLYVFMTPNCLGLLRTHPYMVPRWIWPQTLSFFSRIILRYSMLNSSDPINIQFSKILFLHFWPKLSCLFTFFKNFCPWHNLHVLSNILCLLWLFSTFLSFAPEPLKVWKFKNSEKWAFWGTRAYLSNGAE